MLDLPNTKNTSCQGWFLASIFRPILECAARQSSIAGIKELARRGSKDLVLLKPFPNGRHEGLLALKRIREPRV
jgi:hypothetical protein